MASTLQACDFPALWVDYINNGKLEEVIALYSENAILMPTFSPHSITDKDGLRDYFTQLASREALHVKLHENTVVCLRTEGQSYVISGIYSFEFKVDDTLLTFPSRFTFVIDLSQDTLILHHHSSQIPRTLS